MNNNYELPEKGNAYILFGFEAIQARPNLDPYTSVLRSNEETGQIYTSDVHIKHHVRRGLKAYAEEVSLPQSDQCVFYEKEDSLGNPRSYAARLQELREAWKIDKAKTTPKDALTRTLDLPLFGYVHAAKGENFNVNGAVNTLFRPATFHSAPVVSLGRNNAFPQEGKESAGSASVDSLEYGFFLALWEINLNMLRINASGNEIIQWNEEGATGWVHALANGMWKAYSSDRYPSFTQRSQFAQFLVGWVPSSPEISFANPADLIHKLDNKQIKTHAEAETELSKLLPSFLADWGRSEDNTFFIRRAKNFSAI